MKTTLLVIGLTLALLAAGGVALHLWLDMEGVSLGLHGWLALGLGVALSIALGVGLMTLVFLSARRGYDDIGSQAPDPGRPDPDRPDPDRPDPDQVEPPAGDARGRDAQR